jgi:hypothetical protein
MARKVGRIPPKQYIAREPGSSVLQMSDENNILRKKKSAGRFPAPNHMQAIRTNSSLKIPWPQVHPWKSCQR